MINLQFFTTAEDICFMAHEDGELLFKGYGIEGDMYGYCVYSEMEKT